MTAHVARSLRILAFCDQVSEAAQGGSERVTLEVCRRLRDWGASVTILTATPHPVAATIEGIGIERARAYDLSRLVGAQVMAAPGLLPASLRLVRELRPNVLYAHNLFFQSSLAAAVCQRLRGVPLVTVVHTGAHDGLGRAVQIGTRAYVRTAGRFILGRSAAVIAVSSGVARSLDDLGDVRERMHIVPNGVDHDRFRQDGSRNDAPLVVFVGRLIDIKGPDLLVTALHRLRSDGCRVRALLIGDGPMRATLERRVRDSGLAADVSFAGVLQDVAPSLRSAHILVLPSRSEGLSLTLLEAMASGLCVLASDVEGNKDVIEDGVDGLLFRAGDARSLADRLRRVIEDPNERARLGAAARRTAMRYSWDACAEATAKVLAVAAKTTPITPAV